MYGNKVRIFPVGLVLCFLSVVGAATAEEKTVQGQIKAGAPCMLLVGKDGKTYSLKGVRRSELVVGQTYQVTGRALQVSNCQQGTTLQISVLKKAD